MDGCEILHQAGELWKLPICTYSRSTVCNTVKFMGCEWEFAQKNWWFGFLPQKSPFSCIHHAGRFFCWLTINMEAMVKSWGFKSAKTRRNGGFSLSKPLKCHLAMSLGYGSNWLIHTVGWLDRWDTQQHLIHVDPVDAAVSHSDCDVYCIYPLVN